jgi:hypothetical protein
MEKQVAPMNDKVDLHQAMSTLILIATPVKQGMNDAIPCRVGCAVSVLHPAREPVCLLFQDHDFP